MSAFCCLWSHDWSKWQDIVLTVSRVYADPAYAAEVRGKKFTTEIDGQLRACGRCGLKQRRRMETV